MICGEIIAVTERADAIAILLWFVAAIGIVLTWGPKTFAQEHWPIIPAEQSPSYPV